MKAGIFLLSLAAFFLAACGSDSGTDSIKKSLESNVQYETFDDLPNCTSNREGEIAEILDDGETYVCKSKKWEEYVDTELKSYKTEDDMPNCNSKKEDALALVEKDSVVQVCKDSRWETLGHLYASEDALPNCTKKRDGEKAYLMEEGEVQVCNDGVWGAIKDNNDKNNELKSSDSKGSSSSKVTESSSDSKIESSDGKNPQSNNSGDIKSSDSGVPTSGSSGEEKSSSSVSGHSSTSIAPGVIDGTFTDPRDGQKYRTVKIGDQEWFAQNLNYDTGDDNSRCPLDELSYCKKYGRLYQHAGNTICPTGWHIPYEVEWRALFTYVADNNGGEGVGKSLKATSGWYDVGYIVEDANSGLRVAVATGNDLFHFSVLPAGSCWESGCYSDDDARFFTAMGAGYRVFFDNDLIELDGAVISNSPYMSIRCVKDFEDSGKDSSVYDASANTLTDLRDGQVYRTTVISPEGTDYSEVWMAQNLNYRVLGSSGNSYCSNPDEYVVCETDEAYGRFYQWRVAAAVDFKCGSGKSFCGISGPVRGVCPKGWHLPSKIEWEELVTAVGDSSNTAGIRLKSTSGWSSSNGSNANGTDRFGFSALPAGRYTYDGFNAYIGGMGYIDGMSYSGGGGAYFWSSSEGDLQHAYCMNLSNAKALSCSDDKSTGIPVRCLKD